MTHTGPVVLILGSGPNAVQAAGWPKAWFDQIVVMNNAWQVRSDWDALVFPEDFDMARMPPEIGTQQRLVQAEDFVPAQNAYGGFVHAGATMAFTTAYWALGVLKPRVLAFMGCDMVYPATGDTHFYGTGAADPLRNDVTLRDLGAKSARLALVAAAQGCGCVNLSEDGSSLVFRRAKPEALRDGDWERGLDRELYRALRAQEDALGYLTPDGRYDVTGKGMDIPRLDAIDARWRGLFGD
jgi:hypothetical protein